MPGPRLSHVCAYTATVFYNNTMVSAFDNRKSVDSRRLRVSGLPGKKECSAELTAEAQQNNTRRVEERSLYSSFGTGADLRPTPLLAVRAGSLCALPGPSAKFSDERAS